MINYKFISNFLLRLLYNPLSALFFYLFILFLIQPFYEEGSTPSRVSLIKGLFFEPITDWPVNQIFIADFYAFLYQSVPSIPWFSITELSIVLLILVLTYNQLAKLKNPIILIIFLISSLDDVLYMSYTRTASLLLIFAPALLVLMLVENYLKGSFKNFIIGSLLLLLCGVGFMNKPFAVSYALALNGLFVFSYFLIESENKKVIFKSVVLVFTVLMSLYSTIFATYYFKSSNDHKLAISYSSDLYNLNSANSFKQNLSPLDSVGILLLEKNFISDRKYYNQEFVNRVARNSNKKLIDFTKFTDSDNLKRVTLNYIPQFLIHHKVELLTILIFFLFVLIVKQSLYYFKLPILLFLFGSLVVLTGITFMIKSELRVSSPIMLFLIFGVSHLFQVKCNFHVRYRLVKTAFILVLVFLTYEKLLSAKNTSNLRNQMAKENQIILNQLANTFHENQTIIFNLPSYSIVKGRPLNNLVNKGKYRVETYDIEAMTYMESFKSRLINYSGSIDILDFYEKAFEYRENTFFISNDAWNNLLEAYLRLNYKKEIIFIEQDFYLLQSELAKKDLKLYKIISFN